MTCAGMCGHTSAAPRAAPMARVQGETSQGQTRSPTFDHVSQAASAAAGLGKARGARGMLLLKFPLLGF